MFKRVFRLVSILAFLLITVDPAWAQEPPFPRPGSGFMSFPGEMIAVREYLGLTGDQLEKWTQFQIERGRQLVPLLGELRQIEGQLQEEFKLANPSFQVIGQLIVRARAIRQQQAEQVEAFAEQLRSILTGDQMAKLDAAGECLRLREVTESLLRVGFLAPLTVPSYPPPLVTPPPGPRAPLLPALP